MMEKAFINHMFMLRIAPTYARVAPRYALDAPTYAENAPRLMRKPAPIYAWITVVFHRVYPQSVDRPNICVTTQGPYV